MPVKHGYQMKVVAYCCHGCLITNTEIDIRRDSVMTHPFSPTDQHTYICYTMCCIYMAVSYNTTAEDTHNSYIKGEDCRVSLYV